MQTARIVLFALSLALAVPPVPSNAGQFYGLFPLGILSVAIFTISRFVGRKPNEKSWTCLVESIVFACFVVVVRFRIQMI